LLYADDEEINQVKTFMKSEFKWITVTKDKTQSYLGMNIEVSTNHITVDMSYYTQQLLQEFTNLQTYTAPAVKECFNPIESAI
jgi:hypothetical protein